MDLDNVFGLLRKCIRMDLDNVLGCMSKMYSDGPESMYLDYFEDLFARTLKMSSDHFGDASGWL
eukprot:1184845-Karenia_brevis.AAC.1